MTTKVINAQFVNLPNDILYEICRHLNDNELAKFIMTNKPNRDACEDILKQRKEEYLQKCQDMKIED